MKLTTKQLKQIIKEEIEKLIDEGNIPSSDRWFEEYNKCIKKGRTQEFCQELGAWLADTRDDKLPNLEVIKYFQEPMLQRKKENKRLEIERVWEMMNHEDKIAMAKEFLQAGKDQQLEIDNKKKEIQQKITRLGGDEGLVSRYEKIWNDYHFRNQNKGVWREKEQQKKAVKLTLIRLLNKEEDLRAAMFRFNGYSKGIGIGLPLSEFPKAIDWVMENISLWDSFRERIGL
jgi:hypothetical protein